MSLYDFTLFDLINRNAVSFRNQLAWLETADNRNVTFAQLKQKVDRLAHGLQKAHIKKGDRLAVLGKNSLEYFLLFGAAAALGAIVVPINWRLSAAEVAFNLIDTSPQALFVDPEFESLIKEIEDKLPSIQEIFSLKSSPGVFFDMNALLDNSGALTPADVSEDDGLIIIHTAAMGGRPRGALLSHRNVLLAGIHFNHVFNLKPTDIHLNLLPLFHVAGLGMAITSFQAGVLNVNMPKFEAAQAAELIEQHQVTFTFDFAPILASILNASQGSGKNIGSLRAVLGLDTSETIEKYQQMTGGTFYCIYGQTETSGLGSLGPYDDRPGSAGKTVQMADIRLVDDVDQPVAVGQVGEITVKGPLVFQGYWNLPQDTAQAFRNGWHHTGDLGRFDEDGFLWYSGRKAEKELIKPGGENVYPEEVEKVIMMHPAVAQTVVFGIPDPKWKESIKAVCLLKPGKRLTPQDLIDFVGQRIARYKKPQYVEFVDNWPRNKEGATDRSKIKERCGGSPS